MTEKMIGDFILNNILILFEYILIKSSDIIC